MTKQKSRSHDECVRHFSQLMKARGIECQDFESKVVERNTKKPDLLLPEYKTLVEIKTLQPGIADKDRALDIEDQIKNKGIASYEHPDYHERFMDLLEKARRQFRHHPGYRTMVVVYDLFDFWTKQDPRILMEGQQKIRLRVPHNPALPTTVTEVVFHERPFRRGHNTSIGAIAFMKRDNTGLVVFLNNFADDSVRPGKGIFSESDEIIEWPA